MRPTIREYKQHYNKPDQEFPCEQIWNDGQVVVLRYVAQKSYTVAGRAVQAGSSTLGLYRSGERHVFWKMLHPNGELHAYLVHLCEPITIEPDTVTYRDLMLDIWQEPGLKPVLLDEEDVAEALTAGQIDRRLAEAARAQARVILLRWSRIVSEAEADLSRYSNEYGGTRPWHSVN